MFRGEVNPWWGSRSESESEEGVGVGVFFGAVSRGVWTRSGVIYPWPG